jgi:hypothetical protein
MEKMGKIGDVDAYKLTATGKLIFEGQTGTVNGDKSSFYVYVAKSGTNGYDKEPNVKFKVTVGPQKAHPPFTDRWYYEVTAVATVNDKTDGDPYPFLEGANLQVVPVLTYTASGAKEEVKGNFTAGYTTAK